MFTAKIFAVCNDFARSVLSEKVREYASSPRNLLLYEQ